MGIMIEEIKQNMPVVRQYRVTSCYRWSLFEDSKLQNMIKIFNVISP